MRAPTRRGTYVQFAAEISGEKAYAENARFKAGNPRSVAPAATAAVSVQERRLE